MSAGGDQSNPHHGCTLRKRESKKIILFSQLLGLAFSFTSSNIFIKISNDLISVRIQLFLALNSQILLGWLDGNPCDGASMISKLDECVSD